MATSENEIAASPLLKGFLTEDQLALELLTSKKSLARWHKQGRGPKRTRVGRRIFYSRAAVTEWLARCEQDSSRSARRKHQRAA